MYNLLQFLFDQDKLGIYILTFKITREIKTCKQSYKYIIELENRTVGKVLAQYVANRIDPQNPIWHPESLQE